MNRSLRLFASATAFAGCAVVIAATSEWFSTFPAGQGDVVSKRLDEYVKLSKSRSWGKLYDLVCTKALGGVNRQTFISKIVPVQLKIEFWAKEKGMSCRRNYQEQDSEERTTELDGGREDTGVTPAFDRENSYLESL